MDIIKGILLFLIVISLSVTVTLNMRPIYYNDIKALEIDKATGLTPAELKENYDSLISYNNIFGSSELSFRHFRMSKSGRQHFREVRSIFLGFEIMLIVSLAAFLILTFITKRKATEDRKRGSYLLIAGLLPFIASAFIGISILSLGWNKVFTLFHKIAFNNDYWVFDETKDPVILALPEEFFLHEALFLIGMIAVVSVILIALHLKRR